MDMSSFSDAQVSSFRLHRHHLDLRAPRGRLAGVVGDVCGVQAQVSAMARIALWARLRDLTVDDVEQALLRKRTIVKTWSMRGALHLLPSNELLLYLRGLMPTRLPREQRWIQGAGLKEEETTAMIIEALKEGPVTRAQLVSLLAKELGTKTKDWFDGGWGRETLGSNTSWQLVRPAVMRGLVCFGPSHGQEITFTRVDEWLREPLSMPSEEKAEDALVRRHLHAFGPADAKDLWSWSGVYVRRIRVILDRLRDELVEVDMGRRRVVPVEEGSPGLGKGVVGARNRTAASELRPFLTRASGPRLPRGPSPLQTGVQGSRMACSGRPGGWSCRRDLVLSASPSQTCSGGHDVCHLQEGNASEGEGGSLRFGAFPRGSGHGDPVQLENREFIPILHT